MHRSMVDLPLPEGPTRLTNSPLRQSNDTSNGIGAVCLRRTLNPGLVPAPFESIIDKIDDADGDK